MKNTVSGYLILLLLLPLLSLAQNEIPQPKFGKISPDEFKTTSYPIDPDAAAVVLYDKGEAELEGNTKGGFSIKFKRY